jgi:hypothetical protein
MFWVMCLINFQIYFLLFKNFKLFIKFWGMNGLPKLDVHLSLRTVPSLASHPTRLDPILGGTACSMVCEFC